MKNFLGISLILFPFILYGQKPLWINEVPNDARYYHGIGQYQINSSNYRENARNISLKGIAFQISSEISVTSKTNLMSDNRISNVEFSEKVVISTLSNLKDIEFVGEYSDKKSYYVYYRLSKENHRNQIEKASNRAKEFFKPYLEREPFEFVEKLSDLVKTYEQLHYTYGEPTEILTDQVNKDLWPLVLTELENIIRTISIKAELGTKKTTKYKAVYGLPLDEALKTKVSVVLPSPYNTLPGNDLPVEYMFIEGNGDFRISTTMVDSRGISEAYISKIQDIRPSQIVKSYINLKQFKENPTPSAYFDTRLDKISDYSNTTFSLEVSQRKNDVIVIYVKSSGGISNVEVQKLNNVFEEAFSNISEFEIVDRSRAETILMERGETSADVCDSEECRIRIGKTLQVDKFILIDIRTSSSDKILSCQFRLTDINEGTFDDIRTYDAKYRGSSPVQTAIELVPEWATRYYNVLNPAIVNFTANPNIKTPVNLYMNKKYMGMVLPVLDYSLDEHGTYDFSFQASGYEQKEIRYNLTPLNQLVVNHEVVLTKKSRSKAMIRSLIYPGWGQAYSGDTSFPKRKTVGKIFSFAAIFSASAAIGSWYSYFDIKTKYDQSYSNYKNSTLLPSIQSNKETMRKHHGDMTSYQNIAITLSSLYAGVWIVGALESILRFPDYGFTTLDNEKDVKLSYDGELSATKIAINVSF